MSDFPTGEFTDAVAPQGEEKADRPELPGVNLPESELPPLPGSQYIKPLPLPPSWQDASRMIRLLLDLWEISPADALEVQAFIKVKLAQFAGQEKP